MGSCTSLQQIKRKNQKEVNRRQTEHYYNTQPTFGRSSANYLENSSNQLQITDDVKRIRKFLRCRVRYEKYFQYELLRPDNKNGFYLRINSIQRSRDILFIKLSDPMTYHQYWSKLDDFSLRTFNRISNIKGQKKKCFNFLKVMVSRNKWRYCDKKFNLDLAYISKRIIAMGFPAYRGFQKLYRNNLKDVLNFFKEKHKNHVKEDYRIYHPDIFKGIPVACFPMPDHNPCSLYSMLAFCIDAFLFLSYDQRNVLAIHCKAGKGRTGTMICALQIFLNYFTEASDALKLYGERRAKDCKGVTIPSQRRYLDYFAALIHRVPSINWLTFNNAHKKIQEIKSNLEDKFELRPIGFFMGPFAANDDSIDGRLNFLIIDKEQNQDIGFRQQKMERKKTQWKLRKKLKNKKKKGPVVQDIQEQQEEQNYEDRSGVLSGEYNAQIKQPFNIKDKDTGQKYFFHKEERNFYLRGDFQVKFTSNKNKKFAFWLNSDYSVDQAGATPYFGDEIKGRKSSKKSKKQAFNQNQDYDGDNNNNNNNAEDNQQFKRKFDDDDDDDDDQYAQKRNHQIFKRRIDFIKKFELPFDSDLAKEYLIPELSSITFVNCYNGSKIHYNKKEYQDSRRTTIKKNERDLKSIRHKQTIILSKKERMLANNSCNEQDIESRKQTSIMIQLTDNLEMEDQRRRKMNPQNAKSVQKVKGDVAKQDLKQNGKDNDQEDVKVNGRKGKHDVNQNILSYQDQKQQGNDHSATSKLIQINFNKYDLDKMNKNKKVEKFYFSILFEYYQIKDVVRSKSIAKTQLIEKKDFDL